MSEWWYPYLPPFGTGCGTVPPQKSALEPYFTSKLINFVDGLEVLSVNRIY